MAQLSEAGHLKKSFSLIGLIVFAFVIAISVILMPYGYKDTRKQTKREQRFDKKDKTSDDMKIKIDFHGTYGSNVLNNTTWCPIDKNVKVECGRRSHSDNTPEDMWTVLLHDPRVSAA